MKILIDANLSWRLTESLAAAGHDVSHVHDHGLMSASDQQIMTLALEVGACVLSADSDFATLLALSGAHAPSLILLRSSDRLTPSAQCALLLENLSSVEADLKAGAVVSISSEHLRVRALPIAANGISPP